MSTYKFVTNYDDWEGIYDIDGILIAEGHHLNFTKLFNEGYLKSGHKIEEIEVEGYWLQEEGSLPYKYVDFLVKEGK